jgi:hypothetical protein
MSHRRIKKLMLKRFKCISFQSFVSHTNPQPPVLGLKMSAYVKLTIFFMCRWGIPGKPPLLLLTEFDTSVAVIVMKIASLYSDVWYIARAQ